MDKTIIEALEQIEQMSDPGSYETAIVRMKAIATEALKKIKQEPEDIDSEDELWEELIKIVESNKFMSTRYYNTVQRLKKQFTIKRKQET